MDNTQMTNCNYCGTPLVNGVCPNCHPEMFVQQQAYAQTVPQTQDPGSSLELGITDIFQSGKEFTPYCYSPEGEQLQQMAGEFGFFKEKDEKLQCVYSEKNLFRYITKQKLNGKGFIAVTKENAYFGGKMSITVPHTPIINEKCLRAVKLKDITDVGTIGKYLDSEKIERTVKANSGKRTILYFLAIIAAAIVVSLIIISLSSTKHNRMNDFWLTLKVISPFVVVALIIVGVSQKTKLNRLLHKFNGKLFYNIQYNDSS